MASWERGDGWRVVGAVVKEPFCRETFGRLTIGVPGRRGEKKIDVVSFDAEVIGDMRALGIGQTIAVTGGIEIEAVTNRAKEKVLVDGYAKWVPLLVAKKITVEGASVKPAAPPKTDAAATDGW